MDACQAGREREVPPRSSGKEFGKEGEDGVWGHGAEQKARVCRGTLLGTTPKKNPGWG